MKQHNTTAIILRRLNFGEADRIMTVLTPDKGKLSLIAKGVRKSKSKLAGGLELFSVTEIGYIEGKSELKTVITTRLKTNFGNIVRDIDTTMMAYDFLKQIDSATKEACESEYFELLDSALSSLNDNPDNLVLTNVWFSVQLLGLKGVGINLDKQVNGDDFDESTSYQFDFENMGFFEHSAGPYTPKHIKFLRILTKVTKPENLIKVSDVHRLAADLISLLEQCQRLQ